MVNSYIHQFGSVTIFVALFAATQVNGDLGCKLDFEHDSEFDLECNDLKNTWTVNNDAKDSPKRKVLILEPGQDGCIKTKKAVTLNATSPISLKVFQEKTKNEAEKITLRLIPKKGTCPDEDCVWDLTSDAQYKPGEWVTAKHEFEFKSPNEYYVEVQVETRKGKFLLDSISLPTGFDVFSNCQFVEASMKEIGLPGRLIPVSEKSLSPGFAEISKNFVLTSVSVLTLNNLLN